MLENKNELKGKLLNIPYANGLSITELPEELNDLTYLELFMIKKKIIFLSKLGT